MSESFGARLRQQRERQEIALDTIAEQTKIKQSLLDALERDDVSHWPSGIFRRAFIRAYAHAIGLNPDAIVREFLEVHPDPVEVAAAAAAAALAADAARMGGGPPTRLRNLVGSAIGSLSRLRRSPAVAVEDLVVAGSASVNALASEPHLPAAAHPSPEPGRVDPPTNEVAADATPVNAPASSEPDFLAAAHLCTELGRVENASEVQPLLQEAARILDAKGVIVWVWDPQPAELRPALAYGYSDSVLAQLPTVKRDTDNATAAAFRSAQTCAINGSDDASGALAVPLLTPAGCAGVLAIELQHGSEQTRSVQAVVTILAAQLAQLIPGVQPSAVRPQADLMDSRGSEPHPVGSFRECATLTEAATSTKTDLSFPRPRRHRLTVPVGRLNA
jgi:transcriptional regulator with XRE-family HTH domain